MSVRVPSLILTVFLALGVTTVSAQQPAPAPQPQSNEQQAAPNPAPAPAENPAPAAAQQAPAPVNPPAAQAPPADKKIRVFIDYTESWSVAKVQRGGDPDRNVSGRGHDNDKDSPEAADIMKSFRERCPEFTITQSQEKANYGISVTKTMPAGATSTASGLNKVVLTSQEGDILFSNSTRLMKNAIKDVCYALKKELGMPVPEKK